MKEVTVRGKSVNDALSSALRTLNTTQDQVNIELLEKPKKGLFGFGSRLAKLKVTIKRDPEVNDSPVVSPEETANPNNSANVDSVGPVDLAAEYLKNIIEKMGIDISVEIKEKDVRHYDFQLKGEQLALLIGKRGQTLNAFQYLANIVANQHSDHSIRIVLNAEDYRERRRVSLESLAERTADKVSKTGRSVRLEPMPAFERKVIHTTLQGYSYVETTSIGEEPHRYVNVQPKTIESSIANL